MLNDREYMRRPPRPNPEDVRGGFHALIALIIVNVILWLFGLQNDPDLVLSPEGIRNGQYWQIFTAMFLHFDFWHLFFNMFSLYILGSLSAPVIGAKRFLILYFVSGAVGNLLWLGASWDLNAALLGASGAVAGITIASAMIVPDIQMFLLLIPFPIKLRTMAIILFVLNIMSHVGNIGGNVAYLAHIGGFIGGMLLMRFAYRRYIQWDPLAFLGGGSLPNDRRGARPAAPPKGWTIRDDSYAPPPTGKVSQKELDALLDKLSRGGINSLSEAELARLRQAREQMRGDKQ